MLPPLCGRGHRCRHRSLLLPAWPHPAACLCAAALNFSDLPQEAYALGGVALAALVGIVAAAVSANASEAGGEAESIAAEPPLPRENATLVFGATGRMGRTVVQTVSLVEQLAASAGLQAWPARRPASV